MPENPDFSVDPDEDSDTKTDDTDTKTKTKAKSKGGGGGGFWSGLVHDVTNPDTLIQAADPAAGLGTLAGAQNVANDLPSAMKDTGKALSFLDDSSKKSDKKKTGKGDGGGSVAASTAQPESAYEQLANAQADQYLAVTKSIDPLTTGAALPTLDASATAQAEADLGPNASPVAQWLGEQNTAAAAQNQGVVSANNELANAQTTASNLESSGLQAMGTAETQMLNAAPYQQLLQSLAAEVPYHLASGYTIPGLTTANQPSWLTAAEANAGVEATAAAKGTTPAAQGLLPAPTTQVIPSASTTAPTSDQPASQTS